MVFDFNPRRLKAYNRKILNIHSFRSKYIWEAKLIVHFSSYNNLNYYSRLNQSFQKLTYKNHKRKDIKLSNSKA